MRLDAVPAGARVVVAMSGGVDSSAVAALLHEGGYEVVGVTLQLYDHGAATARKGARGRARALDGARRADRADATDLRPSPHACPTGSP
jgi:tRNA-specific 2-thiouridylase